MSASYRSRLAAKFARPMMAIVGAALVVLVLVRIRDLRAEQRLMRLFDGPSTVVEVGEAHWLRRPVYEYDEGELDDDPEARLVSPSVYRERAPSDRLHITYPPDGAVFPDNFCEPKLEWADERNNVWQVTVSVDSGAEKSLAREREWRFPRGLWREVRKAGSARVVVKGCRRAGAQVEASRSVGLSVSRDPCDEYVAYRMVTPPFDVNTTPDTFFRSVSSFDERPLLLARQSYCFNCHSFSSRTPEEAGLVAFQCRFMGNVEKEVPVYFGVYDLAGGTGWRVKLPFEVQMTTFMRWSPDGRQLALSANQKLVTYVPVVHETQYTSQPTSDVAIYDAETGVATLVPGASDPEVLELMPEWMPDGRRLVFCVGKPGVHPTEARMDMKVVDLAAGVNAKAVYVDGASRNGKSNYYARFSPDGRWMVFCQSLREYLIQPSSDLYIMRGDLSGGSRALECNAPFAADSWHGWSMNSKWVLFASKRDDGVHARVYFTHIDDAGRASPAVRLPLLVEPSASFNIPEFVPARPDVSERALFDAINVDRPYREAKMGETP